jgi:hypothetical protein
LYYFGARYYDPETGRFITRDTVFGDLTDPQSQNRYVYCRNNPQKYTDPDGNVFMYILGAGLLGGTINAGYYWATHRNNFNAKEFGTKFASGFAGGVIGGVTAVAVGTLGTVGTAAVAGEAAKGVVSVTVSTLLGTPTSIATEMVINEFTNQDQIDDVEIVNRVITTPATKSIEKVLNYGISEGVGEEAKEIYKELISTASKILTKIISDVWDNLEGGRY